MLLSFFFSSLLFSSLPFSSVLFWFLLFLFCSVSSFLFCSNLFYSSFLSSIASLPFLSTILLHGVVFNQLNTETNLLFFTPDFRYLLLLLLSPSDLFCLFPFFSLLIPFQISSSLLLRSVLLCCFIHFSYFLFCSPLLCSRFLVSFSSLVCNDNSPRVFTKYSVATIIVRYEWPVCDASSISGSPSCLPNIRLRNSP
jgi:hypothetical protein